VVFGAANGLVLQHSSSLGLDSDHAHDGGARNWRMAVETRELSLLQNVQAGTLLDTRGDGIVQFFEITVEKPSGQGEYRV